MVPAKEAAAWIMRALASIANQTDPRWTVQVVVDRSSTDGTLARALEFKQLRRNRGQVHVNVSQKPGLPHVYREMIERAEPYDDICGILDSDDWLDPNAVSIVRSTYHQNPKLGCVWTQFWDDPRRCCGWSKALPVGVGLREAFRTGWWGAQHFRTFRKSMYLRSPYPLQLDLPYATDLNLALVLAATDCPGKFINQRVYHYVRTPGSISLVQRAAQRASAQELTGRYCHWLKRKETA